MIVVDTNIIAYLWIPGENNQLSEQVLEKDPEWIAPILWRSEFRSVLAGYMRTRKLSLAMAGKIILAAEAQLQGKEYLVASQTVFKLVKNSGCSAYDCEFVVLAEEKKVPLITFDRKVLKAFSASTRHPEDFLDEKS